MLLTDTKLRSLKPAEKPQRFFDGDGPYLEVRPNGGKWWRFKYSYEGKEKRISFGTYPEVPLSLARTRRAEARQLVAAGTDPSAARKEAKETKRRDALSTVEAVSRAWLAHRATAWTPGTRDAITASLENHVFPSLGKRPIREIVPRDIKQVIQAVDRQGAGETAGRVFQRLRSITATRYPRISSRSILPTPSSPQRSSSHETSVTGVRWPRQTCRRSYTSSTGTRATHQPKPRWNS
ncbi:tyrosine-type recombinase/integrase [Piscinibacter koreensis]|uniref:tyrosine-type recombinase/integrase n=1 Tax=Piscinibacter koreensis TaxID=2742824 RepID=UPI001FE30C35|nr:integrase arm-type DNA-binding domain-containing protein [Schlegelella koreensis]